MATAVINEKFVDLAKKPLPAMTADDIALSKVMKQVGPAFAALRTGIDGANAEAATKNVAVLKQMFAETETFWKTRSKPDAMQWAQDARKQVDLIEHAVVGGKLDDAKRRPEHRPVRDVPRRLRERLEMKPPHQDGREKNSTTTNSFIEF
jgi:hypothetical protein